MTVAKQTTADGTLELTISVPWADISSTYDSITQESAKKAELPGFRKGKAPQKLVNEKLDENKIFEEVIKHLLPRVYNDALKQTNSRPIMTPKVELRSAKKGEDWVIIARTCERPSVTIGNYKEAITMAKGSATKKIWVPGEIKKDEEKDPSAQTDKKPSLDILFNALLSVVTTTIPSLLVEHEVNRLLSDLIDQTKQLGMNVEQYLSSTGRTADSIRHEYEEQARRTLTLEFTLEEVADKEGILVSDDDVDTVIKTAKSDDERKGLEKERYYLASILRRQKTIDFLTSL